MVSFPLLFGYTWGSREEWRSRKNTSSPKFSWTCLALMKTHSRIQYLLTKCLLHARSYAGCWRLNREQNRKSSARSLHFSGRFHLWWCGFHKLWFMSVTISLVTVWSIDWGRPRAESGRQWSSSCSKAGWGSRDLDQHRSKLGREYWEDSGSIYDNQAMTFWWLGCRVLKRKQARDDSSIWDLKTLRDGFCFFFFYLPKAKMTSTWARWHPLVEISWIGVKSSSQVALVLKSPPAGGKRDADLIPGWGRSPGGGHGNPPVFLAIFQYPCLENPHRGAWQATVHGGGRELDTTEVT